METYRESIQNLNNLFSIKQSFIDCSFCPNPELENAFIAMLDGALKALSIIWNRTPEEILADLESL